MAKSHIHLQDFSDLSFKVYHELMRKRIREILLVSSPYDAFIMEEDGRLAERIVNEYRGLNLTHAPRLTWVPSAKKALFVLSQKRFDLVITMPRIENMDPLDFAAHIKEKYPRLFVCLLLHSACSLIVNDQYMNNRPPVDKIFVWSGNTDLLLSIIKSFEDNLNVDYDTWRAKVRVIILVEDSPVYCSSILPLLYKEVVLQTQAAMEGSVNQEHRLLMMRARPKILLAETFEDAVSLYRQYKPYLLSVFSDVRFLRNGKMDDDAGFVLLDMIKKEFSGMPVLVLSSDEANREKALKIPAVFLNKNSSSLHTDIRSFLIDYLAFGDFVFRLPDGKEVARVSSLLEMEKVLSEVPDESVYYHARRDHFSTWLMARSEIELASKLQAIRATDFSSTPEIKRYLISCLSMRRKSRQKGVVTDFSSDDFDDPNDFMKIGKGSLGGKARGLAFMSSLFESKKDLQEKYPQVSIFIPKTLVISTDGFDSFIKDNNLLHLSELEPDVHEFSDEAIEKKFLEAGLPAWLCHDLKEFLAKVKHPLAVRSSSLIEDAQYIPCAGIYKTYMLPNNHPDLEVRLKQLIRAVKLVYASTYMATPKVFAKTYLHRTEEEKMAVILQQITGQRYGDYFFPAVSGTAQSCNYYPLSYMKPEEGIAHIAFGFGKTVVEGGKALTFFPKYPRFLPQFSTVDDILQNSQRFFYALKMNCFSTNLGVPDLLNENAHKEDPALVQMEIDCMPDDMFARIPAKHLFSTYIQEDHKIRDTLEGRGERILTFAGILKYNTFPLSELLVDILDMGHQGMGCPVEIEFAVNLNSCDDKADNKCSFEFALLQIRPLTLRNQNVQVDIVDTEIAGSLCFSDSAVGNGLFSDISDIIYIKPESFNPAHTIQIASEIGKINKELVMQKRRYLLIGPGRWGSADRWLGIPVTWNDISGVGAMIEISKEQLHADPSYGTHFFHNISSLGIGYLTVLPDSKSFIDFDQLNSLPFEIETDYLRHVRLNSPLTIKIDGKKSRAVILMNSK